MLPEAVDFEQGQLLSTCVSTLPEHSMGSKSRKKPRRSSNGSQCDRFPVGELARRRATLREEYLSKSKEISALQKRIQRLKKKVSLGIICGVQKAMR